MTEFTAGPSGARARAERTTVLFLCTGNSARSQMAEALLERDGGEAFDVESAGVDPKGVNPYTVRVLDEIGIDWSAAQSKAMSSFFGRPFDLVITVCDRARQACPFFPGAKRQMHWDLEDPAEVDGTDEEKLVAFRTTRDLLAGLVAELVGQHAR